MSDLIFLVGYRGVGKTTIGKGLAKSLEYDFLDTDEEIVRLRHAEITDIVTNEGWEGFRRYEREVLRSLRNLSRTVVATGGGAVVHRQEWKDLGKNGVVVWLTAEVEVLRDRLHEDQLNHSQRPSLTGTGLEDEIATVLSERNPLYQQISHHCLDTGMKEAHEIVHEIVRIVHGSIARAE